MKKFSFIIDWLLKPAFYKVIIWLFVMIVLCYYTHFMLACISMQLMMWHIVALLFDAYEKA